jgi:hypothetical protein
MARVEVRCGGDGRLEPRAQGPSRRLPRAPINLKDDPMRIARGRRLLVIAGATLAAVAASRAARLRVDVATYHPAARSQPWRAAMRTGSEHDAVMRTLRPPQLYILRFDGPRSGLLYFGAEHSTDPDHPQYSRLQALWNEFRPTVALVEDRGGQRGLWGYRQAARYGEPSATLYLAHRDGVRRFSLEPERAEGWAEALRRFSPEQVVLKEFTSMYWSHRREGPVSESDAEALLRGPRDQAPPPMRGVLLTTAEVDAVWKRDFPELPNWRQISEAQAYDKARPANYLHEMSVASDSRDNHWMQVIIELVSKGERVFATGGSSHVIMQEPVLRAELDHLGVKETMAPQGRL